MFDSCLGCMSRHIGCHCECTAYKQSKIEYEKIKAEREKDKNPLINRCEFLGNAKTHKRKKRWK